MQSVTADFTTMSTAAVRKPIAEAWFAWDRYLDPSITFFTIGVSTIGGTHLIAGDSSPIADIFRYRYIEETDYVTVVEVDRSFDDPFYTIVRAAADVILNNVSGRFTPNGNSDIAQHIKQGRPLRLYFGLDYGTREVISEFAGQVNETPEIDDKNKQVRFHALDVMDVILSVVVGQTAMFTDTRTDVALASLLEDAGLSPDQYLLDEGNQTIPFIYFQVGTKLSTIISKLLQVETGIFYLTENNIFRFDNQRRRAQFPLTSPVFDIPDSLVLTEQDRNVDTIINSVTVKAQPRAAAAAAVVWTLGTSIRLIAGESKTFWINYDDPMISITTPSSGGPNSNYTAGFTSTTTDATANLALDTFTNFAQATKVTVRNTHATLPIWLTGMNVYGVAAEVTEDISVTIQDQASIDEYGEHPLEIENDYIQTRDFAEELAQNIVDDRKDPYNSVETVIRGIPQLSVGDVVTRNGVTYEIIRNILSLTPQKGLIQRLWLRR